MALVEPEVLEARRGSDDRRAVGRIGDGAVIDLLDADLAEGGHARDRRLDMGREAVEIFLEELVFALRRGAVDIAGGRADLVGPEQQAARFLAHVPGGIGLAQHPHLRQALRLARLDRRMRLGDDILVLHRDDRHVEADHAAGLAGEIAGRRHDVLADDVALVGDDLPLAARQPLDGGDDGVAIDLAAAFARRPCASAWVRSAGWI